jgi:hypothetical protein
MPKQEFPMVLYDAQGKDMVIPLSDRAMAQYDAAIAAGWAEDPDTAAGRQKPDADRPADTPWQGDVPVAVIRAKAEKQDYPMTLYHLTKPAVTVQNIAQHNLLGDGWYESPDEAIAAASPVVSTTTTEKGSTPPADPPPAVPLDIVKMSAREAVLYVGTIDDLNELSRVATAEEAGGNRVTVKAAIEARLEVLANTPIDQPPPPAA